VGEVVESWAEGEEGEGEQASRQELCKVGSLDAMMCRLTDEQWSEDPSTRTPVNMSIHGPRRRRFTKEGSQP
jgi:hypothetical protein